MCQGFLWRKSTRAFLGKHFWQKRYFRLEQDIGTMDYYRSTKNKIPLGVIPVQAIISVEDVDDSKKFSSQRFEVHLEGNWVFELRASSRADKERWVLAIQEMIQKSDFRHVVEKFREVKFWKLDCSKKIQHKLAMERKKAYRATEADRRSESQHQSRRSRLCMNVQAAMKMPGTSRRKKKKSKSCRVKSLHTQSSSQSESKAKAGDYSRAVSAPRPFLRKFSLEVADSSRPNSELDLLDSVCGVQCSMKND